MSLTVTALMLNNGSRPKMLKRALDCYFAQTYPHKRLLLVDSSRPVPGPTAATFPGMRILAASRLTIGELRNVGVNASDSDLIAHFDDDDWSHPRRLEEQVRFLEESGAAIVGYRDMLVWDTRNPDQPVAWTYCSQHPQACIGATLLYKRSAWAAKPFMAIQNGEDTRWLLGARPLVMSSFAAGASRFIAAVHGGNSGTEIAPGYVEWQRAMPFKEYCWRMMEPKL